MTNDNKMINNDMSSTTTTTTNNNNNNNDNNDNNRYTRRPERGARLELPDDFGEPTCLLAMGPRFLACAGRSMVQHGMVWCSVV